MRVVDAATLLSDVEQQRSIADHRVFVLDADCTVVRPVMRMIGALQQVAQDGLQRLASPEVWRLLPGLHARGWPEFVREHELAVHHPGRHWGVVEAAWRRFLQWEVEALSTDEPAAGVLEFIEGLRGLGVTPVVVTGRPQWMREATEVSLWRLGLDVPVRCARQPGLSTPQSKVAVVRSLVTEATEVVGGIDDELENVDALSAAFPSGHWLHHTPPGFTEDPRVAATSVSTLSAFTSTTSATAVAA